MDARERAARSRRRDRGFVLAALAVFAAAALLATWPAIRHVDSHYLAWPSPGEGEAAAGDHLQLAWAFWLPGHQLERGAAPWADPYSFRPEAEAAPNVQGWLLGLPYWVAERVSGPVSAYNIVVLLSFLAAGAFACAWLRAVGLGRPASLLGGLAFTLAPYLVGQRAGHLLGLVAFLLPAVLLALERRRFLWAALALAAIPASGQLHLALGAIPLAVGYTWARVPRRHRARALAAVPAVAAGLAVHWLVVRDSIAQGRSFAQVERYSVEASGFATRSVPADVEQLVFLGWLTPLLAIAGLAIAWRKWRGLAVVLGVAVVVPGLLALGANLPGYELLWRSFPPLHATRVPERLLPITALAIAALAACSLDALERLVTISHKRWLLAVATALLGVALAADVRLEVFDAVAPDRESAAYAAMTGDGRLLELPVFRPDVHYGSVYVAYARQSPRERPLGYSTTAPRAADRVARELEGLSCGRGSVPASLGIRYVALHGGLYRQSGAWAPGCAAATAQALTSAGWTLLARDGPVATYAAP